jgi:hypothetical protein
VRSGRARRRGGLLWHREFRLLWIGETVSGAGTAMAAAGVRLLAVTVLHASTFAVAALTAAAYLPWLVIGLPAGAWVDRLSVRPLMIACDGVSALLYASLPAAAWAGMLSTVQVVAVALLAGRPTSCSRPGPVRTVRYVPAHPKGAKGAQGGPRGPGRG